MKKLIVLAASRDVRRVPLLDEPAPHEARHPQLVLDHQDAHVTILRLEA